MELRGSAGVDDPAVVPQLTPGTYTGQSQAAWSLAGNDTYVVLGGEFPTVDGTAQQGLVRMAVSSVAPNKQGPTYTTKTATQTIPATTATSAGAGKIAVSFGTAWDYDNESLTYDLFRDNVTIISSTQVKTTFWTLPRKSFTDTGLTPGTSHSYQVRIKDSYGNTLWSPKSSSVTA